MRTIRSGLILSLLVVTMLAGETTPAVSEDNRLLGQLFGRDKDAPPCGRGTQGTRFVLLDNGTNVCDNASGLVWERTPVGTVRTFAAATTYCATKGTGWIVPDIKDFFTVVDYANVNPPLPSGHPFEIPVNSEYWSRTPRVTSPDEVWTFVLDFGRTFFGSKSGTSDYVWCVRY